jgi:hypothetical protein
VDEDLGDIEAAVQLAIRRRRTDGLRLLGHGEISLVLGWPTEQPTHAVKRVPPFRDADAAEHYVRECRRFFALLDGAGVAMLPTELLVHTREDGRAVVFHRQPVADAAQLGTSVLRTTVPVVDHPLVLAVADAARKVCSPAVGFDVQMANWLWDGTTARQIDFTSPFLIDGSGQQLTYDSKAFLQEYPVVLRPYLKRELLRLVQRFTTVEGALGDMVANLLKEGLDEWVEPRDHHDQHPRRSTPQSRRRPADARCRSCLAAHGAEAEKGPPLVAGAHRPAVRTTAAGGDHLRALDRRLHGGQRRLHRGLVVPQVGQQVVTQ